MRWVFKASCVLCAFSSWHSCEGGASPLPYPPCPLVPVSQLMISEHFGFYLVYSELPAFDAYSVAITCLSPKRALIQLYLLTPLLFWICLHAHPKRHFTTTEGNVVEGEDEQTGTMATLQITCSQRTNFPHLGCWSDLNS